MDQSDILKYMDDSKTVLITGIRNMRGCREDKLELYFARKSNGGGDVDNVGFVDEDTAVVTFDDEAVAASFMRVPKQHVIADILVFVESAHRKQHILQEMLELLAPRPAVSNTWDSSTATRQTMIANDILRCMEDSRSVIVTGIRQMKGCREDKLELYFARRSNGGGDVDRVDLVDEDTAVITFDDEAVAASIMRSLKPHDVSNIRVSVETAQWKQQAVQKILATRAATTTTRYNGFARGQLSNQYHMSDAEIHCSGSGGFFYSEQLSSSESEFNSTDFLPSEEGDSQEYSMDYTDSVEANSQEYSMDYTDSDESVLAARTGPENVPQRSDSNQPITIQCTEDVLNYIQTVHFGELDCIQNKCKVIFDIKNRTSVLIQSAADAKCNIPQATKELQDLIKLVRSKAEEDEVIVTPDEANSKNYAAAIRELSNSTSLLVKNNGRRFVMFGTRPAIDAAKKKLKQMLGCTTKSSANAHYQGHTLQSGGRKMTIADQVVRNSKDQLPRFEKENRTSLKPPPSSIDYVKPSSFGNSIPKSQQQVPKQMALSNEVISIQSTENVLDYIQAVHFSNLDRIQNKYKVTVESKKGATILVKSAAASADVQCIHKAVKEINDLIKNIKAEAETDEYTMTSDEADSKNYSAALKEFRNSTSLLVKVNGKTFFMYGKRSAIDAAKTKLRQMLGCSNGIAPSTNTHCSSKHLKSEGSKRNIAEQVVKTSRKDQVPRIGQENPSSITLSKSMYIKPTKRTSQQNDTRGAAKGTKRFENQSLDSVDGSIYSTSPGKQSFSQSQIRDNSLQMVCASESVKPKIRPNRWQTSSDHHETSECVDVFETKIHDVKVIGRKSDILDEFATVIVCCANRRLQSDSGLAARIRQLCGYGFQSQCDKWIEKHGPVPVGDVVWVDIDDGIACSHVINAVVPRWNGYRSGTEELLLSEMFMKIFTAARDKLDAYSVALPLIGIVTCGIPHQIYAKLFTNALLEFLEQPTLPMQEIRIVDLDETVIRLIENELQVNRFQSHRIPRPTNGSFSRPNPVTTHAWSGAEYFQRDIKSYNGSGAKPRLTTLTTTDRPTDKCPVCLGPYQSNKMIISSCSHACCRSCYKELKKSNAHCPVCRGPLN